MAYKLLLTLSVTQMACERCFSKLKLIKTAFRNRLGQDFLESFILMNVEKDVLSALDPNCIIDEVANKSEYLKNLLLY